VTHLISSHSVNLLSLPSGIRAVRGPLALRADGAEREHTRNDCK
jgi:hypothetical protein